MSMHVKRSPEMEGFVKNKVETRLHGNATEVIGDALRRTQAEDTRASRPGKLRSRSATIHLYVARGSPTHRLP